MNIIVVGCGRVGSQLASYLDEVGHDVVVVDRDAENFEALSNRFHGFTVEGVPIDQDVLRRAGIENCDAVAAVSHNDNMNIMVCQMAEQLYHVPRVIARIYDSSRENIFHQFGLRTLCPTNLTVAAVHAMLTDRNEQKHLSFDSSTVTFDTLPLPKDLVGYNLSEVPTLSGEMVLGVLDANGTFTLANQVHTPLQQGDRIVYTRVID